MNALFIKSLSILSLLCISAYAFPGLLRAQSEQRTNLAVVEGTVEDAQSHPVAGATVSLENATGGQSIQAITDSKGQFRFERIAAARYAIRAKSDGYNEAKVEPFSLHPGEIKSVVILLSKMAPAIEFSDEPQFTVAGVTDTTALGGHGSDRAVRNSEVMSKDTASLARGSSNTQPLMSSPATEGALRAGLAKQETAEAHFQLAEIEEATSRSLDAVRDYQRAAELQPTEAYLFGWGAELLLHHALEPATQVFTKGHRLHPRSVRMLLGLGAALYAQGLGKEAGQVFLEASDLDPADPTPYLFFGRLQTTETNLPLAWVQRMKRFVDLHPENATAHCLYAEALARHSAEPQDTDTIHAQLVTAIALDPQLGPAYLQLGILLTQRKDYPAATAAFQKAIETMPLADEAHFRLAEVYRRTGQMEKAAKETELFREISAQKKQQADRERHEIPQFIYTLRGQNTTPQAPPPVPR